MGLLHYLWSRTAASNSSADAQINWAEGQAPSSVNDSARALMASAAGFRDDISGAIVTGGTSTAYTITSYQIFDTLAHMDKMMIAFTPHATNGATVTLNVDGLGAKPLRPSPSVELPAGVLILGTPYVALYNNSDAVWYLHGYYTNPYQIPIGGSIDWWGSSVPNSSFVFPIGQAISRTTYATLFNTAGFGTAHGVGDGSTTFNVPDVTGRVTAMKEASATRLTSTYFVGDSTALGAVGGGESKTLVTGNLPAYTPAGSVSWSGVYSNLNSGNLTAIPFFINGSSGSGSGNTGVSTSFTGTAQGGTSTPFRTVPPTIVCNKILRVI